MESWNVNMKGAVKEESKLFSLETLRGFYAMYVNRNVRSAIKIRFISARQKLTTNER